MEVTITSTSPSGYLDLTSGEKLYPKFCQQLRRLHPKFRLVKNPRALKVPKQYIKIAGQPESKETAYEERWEIWKEVNEVLKFVFCVFRPTEPMTRKGVFKEPGEYELNLLTKAKAKFEMDYGIAMAQQDADEAVAKLDAFDKKEEAEEKYQKKLQWSKDSDDMELDVKAGALQEKAYNLDPKTKAVNVGGDINMRHYRLLMKKRQEKEEEKARAGELDG